ncbi:MAG TPA: FAD binding domain-containing protein [Burkholderiales bacterium]|nr:FAD binding domain-containing protein [Burkholderiales bacterium]
MKAPSFAYAKPRALDDALALLARPESKALAGGQSLIPSLNLRLSSPGLLVDITALEDLKGIRLDQEIVRVGALATHAEIQRSEVISKHVPLLMEAVRHIAHPAIRNRGTMGGSLALADPAAEYPACALALQATLIVAGPAGRRQIKAADFFKGLFETALAPGELIVAVEFPAQLKDQRTAFAELTRRHGDYAIVGLAAFANDELRRFAFFGTGDRALLAKHAAAAKDLASAKAALEKDLQPPADLYHSSATKLHLAQVLLERTWNSLSTPR